MPIRNTLLYSEITQKSKNRIANFNLFAQLIGSLSSIRFSTVSDRFITEIGKGGAHLKEAKLEMLIGSMRYLKLPVTVILYSYIQWTHWKRLWIFL
jgi:hypothetical protein